jgi:hypothetical protein
MPPEDDENSNEAPGYPPLHPDDDEDGIDIGFHRIPLNNTKKEDENANENILFLFFLFFVIFSLYRNITIVYIRR